MNPFMLLSALVALGFPAVYTLQARGGLRGLRPRASWHEGSGKRGGMSPAEAAALEAAHQEGAASGKEGQGGDELGALLAALLQGRTEGVGITSSDFGQQLAALESGVQNSYDGASGGYPGDSIPATTGELTASGAGGTQPPATTFSGGSENPAPFYQTYGPQISTGGSTANPAGAILLAGAEASANLQPVAPVGGPGAARAV